MIFNFLNKASNKTHTKLLLFSSIRNRILINNISSTSKWSSINNNNKQSSVSKTNIFIITTHNKQQQQLSKSFSTINNNTKPISDVNLFHDIVDEEFELFVDRLEILSEANTCEGFEVEGNDGVLTIIVGNKGTYVINKQTPNRQIWWSSPLSGPKRFDYDSVEKRWVDNRDGTPLRQLLNSEINTLCKYDMEI
ncbi:hypothetical protein DDB_G0293246 [Dictyostelium discoideum AX4]|uniref:Frataxin, mitochondrial n=1 Tax=Dictyostelium discoideum TaxID=44689 RepID=FRDA_DICDI|nr:hypothetical protein DDB_G0293246 [Dictyostelium discoideum AX4]Q54C45.1 RecName: Full=Frataxin, mitochondrial; Short=Fxn; Flags: Precursor [Dictyostelium discoideum]EAL60822.1 hypothetical protein DDB_G0293246 [Dictyostelium discoideum AX4]|eukprot:XP_629221.1 hypothetical protein DDB_G0293246 [Dictyostelium discoideum AX4]